MAVALAAAVAVPAASATVKAAQPAIHLYTNDVTADTSPQNVTVGNNDARLRASIDNETGAELVTFYVLSGPDAGLWAQNTWSGPGSSAFVTFPGTASGQDVVVASFTDTSGAFPRTFHSNQALVNWDNPISDQTQCATANSCANPTSASTNSSPGFNIGQMFGSNGAVFCDPGDTSPAPDSNNDSSDYTTQIDWGDGTAQSTGTASPVQGQSGCYTITGSHDYTKGGTYTVSYTVTDNDTSGAAGGAQDNTISGSYTQYVWSLGASTDATQNSADGQSFSGSVGTITDPNPNSVAGDYSASINWGDGTAPDASSGQITGSSGSYTVNGSHTYADDGNNTVGTTITGPDGTSETVSPATEVDVSDQAISAQGAGNLSATTGTQFSGAVASFTDPNTLATASEYTASINWGDGTAASTGTITGSGGSFTVNGTHTYSSASGSPYTVTVTITDSDNANNTAAPTDQMTVTAPARTITPTGKTITGTEGNSTGTATVGSFTDTNTSDTAGQFSATIDWGDGTVAHPDVTDGSVTGSNGSFSVTGSHTYAEKGQYPIVVKITDTGDQSSTTTNSTANIADAALTNAQPVSPMTHTSGVFGPLATFHDNNTQAPVSDFTATIVWSGGHTSTGTVTSNGNGNFTVSGADPAGAKAKGATATITITDTDGSHTTVGPFVG